MFSQDTGLNHLGVKGWRKSRYIFPKVKIHFIGFPLLPGTGITWATDSFHLTHPTCIPPDTGISQRLGPAQEEPWRLLG